MFPLTSLFIGLKMPSPRRQCRTAQKSRSQPPLRVRNVILDALNRCPFFPCLRPQLRLLSGRKGPGTDSCGAKRVPETLAHYESPRSSLPVWQTNITY
jgi:hypothetical protein